MKDLLGLMGKAKEMQAKFQAMQDEIATLEASGQAGGGLVNVTLTGKFEMKSLKIDPSLFKEDDVEILEDLLLAAHNDAKNKVEAIMPSRLERLDSKNIARSRHSLSFAVWLVRVLRKLGVMASVRLATDMPCEEVV
jgi:DNA-binding YbaB/EbfC family protein